MNDTENTPPANTENSGMESSIPHNVFLVLEGSKAVPLDQLIFSIGRSHDNTLVLDDPRISRHHAEIRIIRDHFVLFDLNSSGGTYVNGLRTGQGLLYPGDLISLAGVNLVFTQDTRLMNRKEDQGSLVGPGQRPTAVFDSSLFNTKKKQGGSQ